MKHVVTAIALMAVGIACAVPAPYPVTINSRAQTAPPIVVYRGNESVFRASFTDGDTASTIGAGEIPFMAWATNATGVNSTSSYEIVSGTTGTVDFTFSPSAVNFAPGRYIYEAGVKSSNGNNRVYRQGVFQIYGSPIGSGVASVNWTTNMNWATINWQNLPSGFEDGLSLTMWYAWLGTNTYVKTESDPNANARIDTLTNTINAAASAAAYAYSPTNPPPVQAGNVTSVNGNTGAVVITAASLGALTNETDAIALAALAAHAAYWPPNATASSWFTFTTNSGAITITGYDIGGGADVVIPDYINGFPVTVIGSDAFAGDGGLAITSASGGRNLLTLGATAFGYSYYLVSVSFPSVRTIGDSAFFACQSLTTVLLPSATSIGLIAFGQCVSLVSVLFPNAAIVYYGAFGGCTALVSVFYGASDPVEGAGIYADIPSNQVTNYVTNPQATGWGATFGGMPVVRLPLYADEMYQDGERVPSVAAIQGIVYSNAVSRRIAYTETPIVISPTQSLYAVTLAEASTVSNTFAGLTLDGSTRYEWTEMVNIVSNDGRTVTWDARRQWSGGVPDLTVTGRYEFALSTMDGVTVQASQTYPTVYEWDTIGMGPVNTPYKISHATYQVMLEDSTSSNAYCMVDCNTALVDTILRVSFIDGDDSKGAKVTSAIGYTSSEPSISIRVQTNSLPSMTYSTTPFLLYNKAQPLITEPYYFVYVFSSSFPVGNIGFRRPAARPANELEIKAYNAGWRP